MYHYQLLRLHARLLATLAATALLAACHGLFDEHPYDVNYDGETSINAHQLERIREHCAGRDTLRVAFISDTHGWYAHMADEIDNINRRGDVDFVVHCGDLTDAGLQMEYTLARRHLARLQVPYVALIGNHDFLGTGDEAYQKLFGPLDFSFIVSGIKFVCLNTNATEYDYLAAVPNFDFLENEIVADTAQFSRTVVVMHAPPYSDQFNNNVAKVFRRYLDYLPGLLFCVYGHNHETVESRYFNDDLIFYGVGSAQKRQFRIFTITPDSYEQEVVTF